MIIFYVLLTMHLYTILYMKPTWCTIYYLCILSILFITATCFGPLQVHQVSGMQDGMKFHRVYQKVSYTE
jgi:hypothetical protein